MRKYNGLLNRIGERFAINKGATEEETAWKARIVYSLLGRMGYASLWDIQNDLEEASIEHFKRRIKKVLASYLDIYPELIGVFPITDMQVERLCDEIYRTFLSTGMLYHSNYRVVAAARSEKTAYGIRYIRGSTLQEPIRISGQGAYLLEGDQTADSGAVTEMFQLQQESLEKMWSILAARAAWSREELPPNAEYLVVKPPFFHGYWDNMPEKTGRISVARAGMSDGTYYLYRNEDSGMMLSPLPRWMTEEYQYRSIANACLAAHGVLPPATWRADGQLVHLKIHYLYPPAELNLLRLYSWPESYLELPSDFNRQMDADVFESMKKIFERVGYRFKEG